MNNNLNFNNYGFPDMNVISNTFLQPTNQNNNTNQNIAEAYEGFIRGNLFNNLYDQYKNYRPTKLVPDNEQAELLLNVDQLTFI